MMRSGMGDVGGFTVARVADRFSSCGTRRTAVGKGAYASL